MKIKSEDVPPYGAVTRRPKSEGDLLIDRALAELRSRLSKPGVLLESPDVTAKYLKLKLAEREYEAFCVLLLDTRHRVIEYVELFHGTVDGASVYPREVVKLALAHNAAAVVLAHNHPSGEPEPSEADKRITQRLQEALRLVDVRVLDHLVIGGEHHVSFAERGLI